MASLVLKSNGQSVAAVCTGRVLIGRKPFNAIQFESRAISRIHAWIDRDGERFYVSDAHSRAGTTVNDQPAVGKVILHDGDVIGIFNQRITFHSTDQLPQDALAFEITPDGANPGYDHHGILMYCDCGAPLWVPHSMAGALGKCAVCKGPITVPGVSLTDVPQTLSPNDSLADMPAITDVGSEEKPPDPLAAADYFATVRPESPLVARSPLSVPKPAAGGGETAVAVAKMPARFPRPQPAAVAPVKICKLCRTDVARTESSKTCSACGQIHHTRCWQAHNGCASYGCAQSPDPQPESKPEQTWRDHAPTTVSRLARPAKTPMMIPLTREIALLGSSLCGLVLGAFTFGVPALAVGSVSTIYALRRRDPAARVAALSAAISVIGVATGVIISSLLWFNRPWWTH
jgi:hypothetical protein